MISTGRRRQERGDEGLVSLGLRSGDGLHERCEELFRGEWARVRLCWRSAYSGRRRLEVRPLSWSATLTLGPMYDWGRRMVAQNHNTGR